MSHRPLFVMHLALQGCMRSHDPEYGLTADTGGHIRYVLDQVRAIAARPEIDRVEIVTRGFRDPSLGRGYAVPLEPIDAKSRLVRLFTRDPDYLSKEELEPEHDSFLAALLAHLDTLPRMPDLVHAHYADAGLIASRLKLLLGIPFVFTAHSLGRVKREHQKLPPAELAVLERRIGFEEVALADADAVMASSRDERDGQLASYGHFDRARTHLIPPGCADAGFAAAFCPPAVAEQLSRFLRDPGRPVVLAIARPVRRKNLLGLVDAFGRCAALRDAANLVIVAGTRDDLSAQHGEAADELRALLAMIDRHDLYGQVAYPKHHAPSEIPGYYAFARERGGVFVNPSFNEPYGLTLLEAAASGVPVVATASGGPADIVGEYRNGVLVDPHDPDAIAAAILSLIQDRQAWRTFAAAGRAGAQAHGWDRHAERYVALAGRLAGSVVPLPGRPAGQPSLLVIAEPGERTVPAMMGRWLRRSGGVVDAIATAGALDSLPEPCPATVAICLGGAEIHRRDANGTFVRDAEWDRAMQDGWDAAAVRGMLAEGMGLRPSGGGRLFLSYPCEDRDTAERLMLTLRNGGLRCGVAPDGAGRVMVLPPGAGMAAAVDHLRRSLGLDEDQVIGIPALLDAIDPADTVSKLPDEAGSATQGPTLVLRGRRDRGRPGPIATA